jgi:hypothetical protein
VANARKWVFVSGFKKNLSRMRILVLDVMSISSKMVVIFSQLGTASPGQSQGKSIIFLRMSKKITRFVGLI